MLLELLLISVVEYLLFAKILLHPFHELRRVEPNGLEIYNAVRVKSSICPQSKYANNLRCVGHAMGLNFTFVCSIHKRYISKIEFYITLYDKAQSSYILHCILYGLRTRTHTHTYTYKRIYVCTVASNRNGLPCFFIMLVPFLLRFVSTCERTLQ